MTRRFAVLLVVLGALAGLAACSGGGGGSSSCPAKVDTKKEPGGDVTVCASDLHFDVDTIRAPVGQLDVKLVNDGAVYHTFKIEGTSFELTANSGKSDEGTVTLKKGTYTFECTVPGHAAAGMKGKIVVGGG